MQAAESPKPTIPAPDKAASKASEITPPQTTVTTVTTPAQSATPSVAAKPASPVTPHHQPEASALEPTITTATASAKTKPSPTTQAAPSPSIQASASQPAAPTSTSAVTPSVVAPTSPSSAALAAKTATDAVSPVKPQITTHQASVAANKTSTPIDSPSVVSTVSTTVTHGADVGGETAARVAPLYEEPKTPLIMPLPEVVLATSISPDVPGEVHAAAEEHEAVTPHVPEPSVVFEQSTMQHEAPVQHHEAVGPHYPHMFIIQITPELAPLAKVGGLADVVTGLSRELEWRGHSVEIILPKYACMHYDHIWGLCKTYDDLWVPWYNGHIHCTVYFGFVHGRKCFFIEPHSHDNFFNRGTIYGFNDDVLRFAFFCRAALEFIWKSGKRPDIIHCHDWQTALVPVFLYEIYQHIGLWQPRVCYTIHNFKHQGVTGDFLLNATSLHRPDYYFHYDRLLDNRIPHALNLMKGGIVYSNFVTTVSPRYAGEAKDGGQGFGLEPTLHIHHAKYGGVVNGIDYDVWNPEIDAHIPVQYTIDTLDKKYDNKRALRHRLLLADNEKPIVAFVGRLDPQKGLDLVRHALFFALNHRAQFVLLGSSPERDINSYFWGLKHHLNDSPDCHIEIGFDEHLAHLIYAGADMIVVPSLFEPCGLTQLIAMKYGTIPIVREVGGLADTVFDKDHAHHKALHERNGYVFRDYNYQGLESALSRAIDCYYQYPDHFRELMKNAMRYDYSWKYPGQHYLNIYDYIRHK